VLVINKEIAERVEEMMERSFILEKAQGFPTNLHVLSEFTSCLEKFLSMNYMPDLLYALNEGLEPTLTDAMFEDFEANILEPADGPEQAQMRVLEEHHNRAMFDALGQQLALLRPALLSEAGVPRLFAQARGALLDEACLAGLLLDRETEPSSLETVFDEGHGLPPPLARARADQHLKMVRLEHEREHSRWLKVSPHELLRQLAEEVLAGLLAEPLL
jgi:hypothetical protein